MNYDITCDITPALQQNSIFNRKIRVVWSRVFHPSHRRTWKTRNSRKARKARNRFRDFRGFRVFHMAHASIQLTNENKELQILQITEYTCKYLDKMRATIDMNYVVNVFYFNMLR